jgi:hypothetical protein
VSLTREFRTGVNQKAALLKVPTGYLGLSPCEPDRWLARRIGRPGLDHTRAAGDEKILNNRA